MAVLPGWGDVGDWLQDPQFIAAMRTEATGSAVWAYWSPGAIRGTAELNLRMSVVLAMANGAGTWARWSPGGSPAPPRGTATIQLDAATAIAANFT